MQESRQRLWDASALHRLYGAQGTAPAALRRGIVAAKRIAFKRGHMDESERIFTRILELAADNAKLSLYVAYLLIDLYYRQGKLQDAQETYERAIDAVASLDKGARLHSLKLFMYAIPVFTAQKRYTEAVDTVARAKAMLGTWATTLARPRLLNLEARLLYEQRGENAAFIERAKELYEESAALEKALPLGARERITNNQLGTVLVAMGDYENAEAALKEKYARETKADNWYNAILTALSLAETHRLERRYEHAERYAAQALAAAQTKGQRQLIPYAHEIMAKLLHDMDRFEEAVAEDRRALAASALAMTDHDYKNASIRLWLHMGHCYKELKRWNEAIVHFEAALSERPADQNDMSALEGTGEAYYYKGDFTRALSYFDKTAELLDRLAQSASTRSHAFRIAKLKADIFLKTNDAHKAAECMKMLEDNIDGDESRKREYLDIKKKLAEESR